MNFQRTANSVLTDCLSPGAHLNFEQRELIEELFDERLRGDLYTQSCMKRLNGGPEPFFIKNLENVQGDERDVIFISCTYGPDARGNQYQRFGPINSSNGHRRLNVLFTRAKKRVEVFSSLDAEKIQVAPNSARGLRALKGYLQYAKSGVLEVSESDPEAAPVNDFELSVGAVLTDAGYQIVPQVGVAGFFIDLGVRHPYQPGAFLLGIECDSASYHSGRSARDRDRLRQAILENLGWKIYRIWSTDWFRSRQNEIKRLLSFVEGLLASDPYAKKERSRAIRIETLRTRLREFRDETILSAFPDSPPEKCLLRDSLLEELVEQRPINRNDWFRKISYELRNETEARQVGRFLDAVLEIVSECEHSA